jgi:hypothetical protein
MTKLWLNLFSNPEGEWHRGQTETIEVRTTTADLSGATVRIYETSRSGCLTLSPVGADVASYGDAEVYLRIRFKDGSSQFLSAPLATEIEVDHVQSIELATLIVVGNSAAERIRYRGAINAHCIYEVVAGTADPVVDQSNLVSSGNLVVNDLQSVGQTFTASRTGRLVGIEVAVMRGTATGLDTLVLEVLAAGLSLGIVSLAGSAIPQGPSGGTVPNPLDLTTIGTGYFDLTALGAQVVAGGSYLLKLTNASSGDFRVGISASVYAGGTAMVNDNPAANLDLAFKVFVQS